MHSFQFCAKPQGQALHTSRFTLLTSSQFLCMLSHAPKITKDYSMLTLTQEDHAMFKALNNHHPDIKKVVKFWWGGRKRMWGRFRWIWMVTVMRISRYKCLHLALKLTEALEAHTAESEYLSIT